MYLNTRRFAFCLFFSALIIFAGTSSQPPSVSSAGFSFPYREEGLSSKQAAAHLLNRFTYGPSPGDVDEVVNMGLENWFAAQLAGNLKDDELDTLLKDYDVLQMKTNDIIRNFPKPLQVFRNAKADGIIADDSLQVTNPARYRELLTEYAKKKGFRAQSEVYRQFFNAKVLRSVYSRNQLHEVLTEFWYNHFNVSVTKKACALFVPNYERDAIRPYVTGKFRDMLMATAKSPAMLIYLDNFSSAGNNEDFDDNKRYARKLKEVTDRANAGDSTAQQALKRLQRLQKNKGLNENYAREVMELHTLGVDGGYTQQDVTEAARVLTGWMIFPMEDGLGGAYRNIIDKIGEDKLAEKGFVHDGDFFFALNRHDNQPKTVMGKRFSGGGYQEGVELLSMLASHASTARFISRKIAVRFVSDEPPKSLVDKMTRTYLEKDGNIAEVLKTMVCSREFWAPATLRSKTKSPFELVISALRAVKAKIDAPFQVYRITDKMGQKMYGYAAPTGYPDQAVYWINSGALLNRMNFGMSLSGQQTRGISCDLLALNDQHEPESAEAALLTYSKLLLPERDLEPTLRRLKPLLTDPAYADKIRSQAAGNKPPARQEDDILADLMNEDDDDIKPGKNLKSEMQTRQMLAQVVGIIIGSPEFQRR